MKSVCKYCAQKEVGCREECADRRAERKERRKSFKALLFGMPRETDELLAFNVDRIGTAQPEAGVTINDLAEACNRIACVPFGIRR